MEKITKIITDIVRARTPEAAAEYLERQFDTADTNVLTGMVIELSQELDDYALGYLVLPVLQKRTAQDQALFHALQELVANRRGSAKCSLLVLDLLDGIVRQDRDYYLAPYRRFILAITLDENQPVIVRARTARMLTRANATEVKSALKVLIDSGSSELVAAACHVISFWRSERQRYDEVLISALTKYASSSPSEALQLPKLLEVLVQSRSEQAFSAVRLIAKQAQTPDDWARLVRKVGPLAPIGMVSDLVDGAAGKYNRQIELALRSLADNNKPMLEGLFQNGHYRQYVTVVAACLDTVGPLEISRLARIENSAQTEIASSALAMRKEISQRILAIATGPIIVGPFINVGVSIRAIRVSAGFSTGLHMGDVMYRDLHTNIGNQNHWHGGVFKGFQFWKDGGTATQQTGQLLGVHMTGWPGDGMNWYEAVHRFQDPNANVVTEMQQLLADFLTDFQVDSNHLYHGARRPPNLSKQERQNIALTAADLMYEDIWWTFGNMLDWKGRGWNGSINDIDNLRCDGVVEYAYEKHGIRVCNGKRSARWNIARGGKRSAKNHNDLHTWGYNQGELCPRVQAGNRGNDTTFITPPHTTPVVNKFVVGLEPVVAGSDTQTQSIIRIDFNVQSSEYYNVYVRLQMGPSGGPFDFVVTDQPNGWPYGLGGRWFAKEVAEGTDHAAYWEGGRHSGQSYYGVNGLYEFRIVAIDKGGNVSDMLSFTIDIDWSNILSPPW